MGQKSNVSLAIRLRCSSDITPIVLMLCNRSAIFTKITLYLCHLTPFFEIFSLSLSLAVENFTKFRYAIYNSETGLPNRSAKLDLLISESSITSCMRPIVSWSIFISVSIRATAEGCVM